MIETVTAFRKCPNARYRNIDGEGIVVGQTAGGVLVPRRAGDR